MYKQSNEKYGKLQAKESEEIPRSTLCIYQIGNYIIRIKGRKENLIIKAVTVINPVTGWFEIMQYNNKRAISILTCLKLHGCLHTLDQFK